MTLLEKEIKALVKLLSVQKIKYIILGGVAVSVYGEPRMTADIDVNVLISKDRIREFLKKAKKHHFYPAFASIKRTIEEASVIPFKYKSGNIFFKCDLIIAENILEYAAIRRGRVKKIGSIKARFISPEDLVIHKITSSRPRDIADLNGVLLRQKGKLDKEYIINWLKKIDRVDKKAKLYKAFKRLLKEADE